VRLDIVRLEHLAHRRVKPNLSVGQNLHLLCKGGQRILWSVRSVHSTEHAHMSNSNVIARIGQGLLALATTGATVVVLQLAMLAP
jgi:hypothetical protein